MRCAVPRSSRQSRRKYHGCLGTNGSGPWLRQLRSLARPSRRSCWPPLSRPGSKDTAIFPPSSPPRFAAVPHSCRSVGCFSRGANFSSGRPRLDRWFSQAPLSWAGVVPRSCSPASPRGDECALKPEVAEEFAMTAAEMRVSPVRSQALENLAMRTGLTSLRGIVATLNQAINFGTPLAESLRVLTAEMRAQRLARFEERAARLPVLLTLP